MTLLKYLLIMPFIFGINLIASEGGENKIGALTLGVKSAIGFIQAGKMEEGMNSIRKGINLSYYERLMVDQDILNKLDFEIKNEKNNDKKGALLVVMSVAMIVNGEKDFGMIIGLLNEASKCNDSLPEIYNTRGILFSLNGDTNKSIQDYTKAIELNKHYLDAYENRARAYMKQNRLDLTIMDMAVVQDLQNALYYFPYKDPIK